MGLVACSDPGTVGGSSGGGGDGPKQADEQVTVGDVSLTRKWCATCGVLRPLRASHCKTTGRYAGSDPTDKHAAAVAARVLDGGCAACSHSL